jgi:hypothetical protein
MFSFRKLAAVAAFTMGMAPAQPALTTIQDILYRADGTRFNGTIYIRYNSFQAGDTSNIATSNLAVPVVNGSLRVRLVPTTTASGGAQYSITYNSSGVNQFTETWAVPPSSRPLRVRDVRLTSGTVVGPPPVISPVQIGDVIGLANELEVRPMRGVGFGIGRAAVINSSGQLDGAAGSLNDCVRVDGSSGPCGSGGGASGSFADAEVPSGAVNGSNTTFLLSHEPNPAGSLMLFRNGLLMRSGTDYALNGSTVTFFVGSTPQAGDLLLASYRFNDPSNPLSSLGAPQVVCSGAGASTSATVLTQLAACTIPSGVLGSGDRIEVRFQFEHVGTTSGFTSEVRVGNAAVMVRSSAAGESLLVGRSDFGLLSGSQVWDTQSWGNGTAFAAATGSASEDTSQAVTIRFRGQMAQATTETVSLRNFTVIRYPAQANP